MVPALEADPAGQYLPPRSRDALARQWRQQALLAEDELPAGWRRGDIRRARLQNHRLGLPSGGPWHCPPLIDGLALQQHFQQRLKVDLRWSCRSTQADWRRQPEPWPRLVISESQRGGRGRLGRSWQSAPTGNLYLSLLVSLQRVDELSLLPLLSGLVIAELLGRHGVDSGLKWPNDVLVNGAKIAGVLVEADLASRPARLAIGVGLNWWLPATHRGALDRPATDLREQLGNHALPDRTGLLRDLTEGLLQQVDLLEAGQGASRLTAWRSRDLLRGHRLRIDDGHNEYLGRAASIDEQGRLLLQCGDGLKRLSSGEVTRVWIDR
ncbi:MAG: biotin--[acetyl-CoA-carboxylase] ligase [Xanthomonadales bacterium]|nr:biotin--[acetyl-CoA-carboxylase] ligase [Xanthomonadales bacterium]